ncbi:hypothetical protein OGAPHI_002066 [Ogataea philodendri]|uniref:Uncharacterized protein n=1 Tax=Ogataea philodendri TaxID=1378263 RepID=A0A9P8PA99_9ASCO|nr:uncharacterized protein OGAPHI_002066 [Ogataea philodendri]KAH3668312.1 hypothetical protein OGAPHI_002066 [Ogataea philodendri]
MSFYSFIVSAKRIFVLELVDTHNPVLTGKGLLHNVHGDRLGVVGAQFLLSDPVNRIVASINVSKPVERQFVHQRVLHGVGSQVVHSVGASICEIVALVDLFGPNSFRDSHHPQELVDVVSRVANESTENHKHIVNAQLSHDHLGFLLRRGHSTSDSSNVSVVPGVVINKRGSVSHATNLVAVVPPGHHLGVFRSVHPQPVVGFSVVINQHLGAVRSSGSQDHRRRRVGIGCYPSAVLDVECEVENERGTDNHLGNQGEQRVFGLILLVVPPVGHLFSDVEIDVEQSSQSDTCANTDNRGKSQHQSDHDTGKVRAQHGVHNDKHGRVGKLLETEIHSNRKQPDHEVEIKEERGPWSRLVFGHRSNDGDVHLSIVGVPKGVESSCPRSNQTQFGGSNQTSDAHRGHNSTESVHQSSEFLWRKSVFQEPDKRNLHGHQGSQRVPCAVGCVDFVVEPAHQQEDEHVQRNDVGDEDVSTPSTDHVEVEDGGQRAVEHRTCVDGLDPEEERDQQQGDCNCLVIIRSGNRSRDVTWGDSHEHGTEQRACFFRSESG